MIKGLKKFSISFLTLLFVFVLGFICSSKPNVFASDDETVLSDYAIRVGELETRNLMGGVTLYKERVKSIYNGIDTGDNDPNSAKYRYTHGTVQWVDLPRLSEDVRVVSWSKGTQDGWTSSTVRTTALDFEAKNPGWIVVAAVNGDSFDINGTKEPTKLHVQDGSVYQPVVGYTQIGWQDDNSPIIGGATLSSNMFLEVLDEQKNIVKQVELASENGTLSETGINLITKDASSTYDLTGYTVYVGKYDTCRISKYNGKSFVKGTIENVVTNLTTNSKPLAERDGVVVREFYLASKDGSLDSFISTGDYVRCQYQLTGSWAGVKNVLCGFGGTASSDALPAQVLKDSQPLGAGSTDSFAYTTHPRTMVGFKEDGSTVLMVCDGRGKQGDYEQGLSYFQEGEMMRLAGCVNAFNLDGGGSSTLVVRNSYGELEVINRPSDGSERYIGNAILFVMRDPGISWDVKNTTRTSATFVLKETEISNQVTDVKVTIDGKSADMVDGVATVEGLKEDTEYVATVEYKVPSSKDPNKILNGFFKVDVKTKPFNMPSSGLVFEDANKTSIKLVKRETAYASWFQDVKVTIGGTEYVMGSNSELLITDLIEDTEYEAVITYNCVEPDTGNVYQGTETKKIKTLSYELPQITKFEVARSYDTKVILSYAYSDPDNVVVRAYIKINNSQEEELTTFQGTKQITNIDLANNEYKFVLVLQYENGTAYNSEIKSDTLTAGNEVTPEVKHTITYALDGGVNSSSNPTEFTEGEEVVLNPATKEGYTFKGWELNGEIVTKISSEVKEDVSLKAIFEKNIVKHTITYNLNGGVNSSSNPTEFTEGEEVVLNSATKEGYTFKGWELNGEIVTKISSEVKEDVVLNAVFEKVEEPAKKGCGCKKSAELVITLTSALSLLVLVIRKKH